MTPLNFLTDTATVEITEKQDSLTGVHAELAAVAEKIATTPTNELIGELMDKAVAFGLKLLAAFVIYFVGAWLIRKVKAIITRMFERKGTDPGIASFTQSIVSIALTIMLIITHDGERVWGDGNALLRKGQQRRDRCDGDRRVRRTFHHHPRRQDAAQGARLDCPGRKRKARFLA